MLCDEQFVCSFLAEHLDSHQRGCYHDCMQTVDSDGLDRMQVLDGLSVRLCERNVPAKIPDCATRLQSAYHVSLCQVLVFQAYCWLDEDSSVLQHPKLVSRER
jgi:hypothetical protein